MFLVALIALIATSRGAAQTVDNTGIISESLRESSGVAVSRTYPGVLWSHNDSDNGSFIYALTLRGELLSSLKLTGARQDDWEDIAVGPCPTSMTAAGDCIYVADTGDNLEERENVSIYVFAEPDPTAQRRGEIPAVRRVAFTYPNGPTDVESLAIDQHATAWLISKGRQWPVRLYSLNVEEALSLETGQVVVTEVDTLSLPRMPLLGWVTAAAISPSGALLRLRTYVDIYSLHRSTDGRWILDAQPCRLGPIEPQGEGLDFLDEETVVLTSESLPGRPGTIKTVVCP